MKTFPLLYVEDEENDVFIMRSCFQRVGVTAAFNSVSDGRQAVQYLSGEGPFADRQTYPLPCLVLLDLKLPLMSGFNVLTWIRAHEKLKTLPVVIFTSSDKPVDIQRAYQLGANGYLVKLPNPADWTKRAHTIAEFWFENNTPPILDSGAASPQDQFLTSGL